MGDVLDPRDVERAKAFWAEKDVDQVFSRVFQCLSHLKQVLLKRTATDKEYVRAQKLLEYLDCPPSGSPPDPSVVQVVIGSGGLLPAAPVQLFNGAPPPAGREELLPPLAPAQLQYHPHHCCKSCLPITPRTPQSRSLLHGQNPLKVPLLCGFKRLTTMPLMIRFRQDEDAPEDGWDVIYKAPCGQSLRSFEDVACFLTATESYDILQVDFFTFNHLVQLDPAPPPAPARPDLSRGAEPTPVELCVGDGESRPANFRYRKDRWPHGCFLTRGPVLFLACCDCTDGCGGAGCACAAMTAGGRGYNHQRLPEPVQSGLYECGPWCGCDRARCQNRLVQRGLRVRLQVYQTEDRGWGVRCRDDLDRGTFVCTYAGVVLQRDRSPEVPPAAKMPRAEPPSDDEVEVVTEWPAAPVQDSVALPGSPRTSATQHVPVIQKPGESGTAPQDPDQVQMAPLGDSGPTSPSADGLSEVRVTVAMDTQDGGRSLKRAAAGDVCVIDASWEGNVGRFINHSCQPNLFIQNVFTDCHDPAFPVIAFFTSRVIKAGTELTWNYDLDGRASGQEVACLCRSSACRGWLHLEENLCDVCEADAAAED